MSKLQKRQKIRLGILVFAFIMFPAVFYYLSPVIIINASREGIINGSFVIFVIMFFSSLFLGRAFCGWVCPGGGCQEIISSAVNIRIRRGNILKWIIWIPWICAIVWFAYKAGGYKKADFFYETTYGLSIADLRSFITYYIVLLVLIVLPSYLIGKRSFCHHLCWMSEFMIIGRAIRNRFGWLSLGDHVP